MRPIALILFLLCSTASFGQNYQPINSHSLQAFYQYDLDVPTDAFSAFNQVRLGNMWGTRIDSTRISLTGDSIYYNYPIYRDTALENSSESCIKPNAANWNGINSIIDAIGSAWFFNQYGDSIRIHYQAQTNEEWVAFNYQNGDSLVATVTNIFWAEDEWISDSVKTIGFQRVSNGTPIFDSFNDVELEVYKTAGFRKMVDFHEFPIDTTLLHRLDINTINKNSPGYSVNNSIVPEPSIGDGYYRITECENLWGSNICNYDQIHFSEQILTVSQGGMSGQLIADVMRNIQYGSSSSATSSVQVLTINFQTHLPPCILKD